MLDRPFPKLYVSLFSSRLFPWQSRALPSTQGKFLCKGLVSIWLSLGYQSGYSVGSIKKPSLLAQVVYGSGDHRHGNLPALDHTWTVCLLGVGICTQRVPYLKTSVMARPHTCLVSKMPRLGDREAIQETFGFSEEMFRQTFKLAPGDWLIASHYATGFRAVPIPIHASDANERILDFLTTFNGQRRVI